jgi:hypothetical protein
MPYVRLVFKLHIESLCDGGGGGGRRGGTATYATLQTFCGDTVLRQTDIYKIHTYISSDVVVWPPHPPKKILFGFTNG